MFSDGVDLREIANQMIETFDLMISRQNAFRDRHGETSIYDIHYTEQLRDPIGQMRKLYAHFDEPLTREAETATRAAAPLRAAGAPRSRPYGIRQPTQRSIRIPGCRHTA